MTHFDANIGALHETLLWMASRAESAVRHAVQALQDRDDDMARAVVHDDDRIDLFEKEVDSQAVILLSRAPLANQLRAVVVSIKIAGALERIGDEATTIARRALSLNGEPGGPPREDFSRMATAAMSMLAEAMKAFTTRDSKAAREVVLRDREVDQFNRNLHLELARQMSEHPGSISRCLDLMRVAKALERVGDHAKNIAENAVYLFDGCDIRHAGSSLVKGA